MLFVTDEDYRNLMLWRRSGNARSIFTFVRYRFSRVSGFRLHKQQLITPPSFAPVMGVAGRDFNESF
jgi:hypothetical protein